MSLDNATARAVLSVQRRASFSGLDADILLGTDTAAFSIIDIRVSHNAGSPAHRSETEDKVFLIEEGALAFLVGEARFEVSPGDKVVVCRGEVHSFRALPETGARMLLISTPALHHQFFEALSGLEEPHDPARVKAICDQNSQHIVGPIVD